MSNIHLNRHHQTTLDSIFRHPAANNLEWPDVEALLRHIGSLDEKSDGRLDAMVGSNRAALARPRGKDVDHEAIRTLQVLLKNTGFVPDKDA